jgi:hypothetical protein
VKAEIIADSINPKGCRLTTYILEYPRFIHAELLTHRVFSKNAASSRAIPIEKMIEQVMENPAMPVWWGKNQSGMQAKEELDNIGEQIFVNDHNPYYASSGTNLELAKDIWLKARDAAVGHVKLLNRLGLHKQVTNRLLEPWFNIRIILSGTEFDNFFALRAHPDAQPELQELAYKMLEEYNKSEPKSLQPGDWHIPFGDNIDVDRLSDIVYKDLPDDMGYTSAPTSEFTALKMKIAIARCARTSYFNYEGKDDYIADIKLCDRLFSSIPRHLSPTEHVAQCTSDDKFIGNFRGWKQYRYELKEIVLRLVTIPLKRIERVIFINQEVTVLKSLIEQHPNLNFWRIFYPGFQVKSLNYFLNAGEVLLKKEYHLFLCPVKERQEVKVSTQKIGDDAVLKPKKNLREWLK